MSNDEIKLPAFPWIAHDQGDACEHVLLTSGKQWVIAFRSNGEFSTAREQAIIRHIVASANACAGLSTERLEKFLGAQTHRSMVTLINDKLDLTQQRDELLAEAERYRFLRNWWFNGPEGNIRQALCPEELDQEIDDAITILKRSCVEQSSKNETQADLTLADETQTAVPALVFFPAGSLGEEVMP